MQTTKPRTDQLTTLTLFGFRKGHIRWGLAQMGTKGAAHDQVPGLLFYKLLGSGKGKGFSIQPNFRRYGLLCTWESEEAADEFLERSELMLEYRLHTYEIWTVKLLPTQAHGLWDGKQPFTPQLSETPYVGPVAVLTRASINWKALPQFWRFTPQVSKALDTAQGLICSIGLGELPLIRQATFSVWESMDAMKAYAYRGNLHQEVIKRTRAEKWYSEELFARFIPKESNGLWDGKNPLVTLLSKQV
ncbi:spheroidene monooxygenase [Pontibacter sp. JH31]|uniref:Spheroidene monooxygenase n=1 Tax=Pontibacter aquaedesilientis TaxID=2766980 RepID=A0ABR7XD61_9BACT|nr:spheroidene monooxygenase [Pontibacter aquaedesilientis]MBD1396235.1 spheroidene monooxygenase [Pontibacter aquaedesilientis]